MNITTLTTVNGKEVQVEKQTTRLELFTPGRGVLNIVSEETPTPGQPVMRIMQLEDNAPRIVFTGYIDAVTQVQKNAWSVTVRELSAALARRINISTRHAKAAHVLQAITEQTGLQFLLPESEWTQKDLPRFQHIGTGYSALDKLLTAFNVQKGIWHQQTDGRVYVGEYEKSAVNKAIQLQPEQISKVSSTAGEIPALPRLRPGHRINVNGSEKYITAIDTSADTMRLTWSTSITDNRFKATA